MRLFLFANGLALRGQSRLNVKASLAAVTAAAPQALKMKKTCAQHIWTIPPNPQNANLKCWMVLRVNRGFDSRSYGNDGHDAIYCEETAKRQNFGKPVTLKVRALFNRPRMKVKWELITRYFGFWPGKVMNKIREDFAVHARVHNCIYLYVFYIFEKCMFHDAFCWVVGFGKSLLVACFGICT